MLPSYAPDDPTINAQKGTTLGPRRTWQSLLYREPVKAKRKLSVAGRKAIQESMRRRWALEAEAAKPTQARKAAPKKAAPAKASTKKVAPVKKTAVKKSATKKTATAPAHAVAEALVSK